MIISTAPFIAGYRVTETKGQVFGLVVRSRGLGGNLMAGLRSIGGGEIHEYTSLLEDTRRQAIDRMVQNATLVGANAVISMRFDSLRARRHDVRDRRLRHRRGRSPRTPARPRAPSSADGRDARPRPDRRARRRPRRRRASSSQPRDRAATSVSFLFLILPGVILIVAAVFERLRYRSLRPTARRRQHGPGGSEPAPPEPRFRPTDERFVDPTTGVQMRVFLDPTTGERRYVAEG